MMMKQEMANEMIKSRSQTANNADLGARAFEEFCDELGDSEGDSIELTGSVITK